MRRTPGKGASPILHSLQVLLVKYDGGCRCGKLHSAGNLIRPKSVAMRDFNWSGEGSERVVDGVVPEIGFNAISLIHPTSVEARNAQPFMRA